MPNVYAIGDLHLCLSIPDKTMEVFGDRWTDYVERLRTGWQSTVQKDDLVLIPGDISWAMRLDEAADDLAFLGALNGRKAVVRGNHDYWWAGDRRVRAALPAGTVAVRNDAATFGDVAVAGSRGWLSPVHQNYSEETDGVIFRREMLRLKMSLDRLPPDTKNYVMLHYPPFNEKGEPSPFAELIAGYPVDTVVYGHLHGRAQAGAFAGRYGGADYRLVAADALGFTPLRIGAFSESS